MVWVCCSGGLVFRVCGFVGFGVFEGFGLWCSVCCVFVVVVFVCEVLRVL